MHARHAVAILFLFVAVPLFAQDASSAAEYGRASGGSLDLLAKHGQPFSGSIGFSLGRSQQNLFGSTSTKGLDGTVGATVIPDRIWFFATAEHSQPQVFTPAAPVFFRSLQTTAAVSKSMSISATVSDVHQ